ncbi:pilus assembly protein [Phycicoccus sp. BSK3Z-2]|uniref:Pilus assembly protein n=1 Tax=Phycicoccus avicenniae TaxID=2828860 RepID=A0A941DAL8_9MICO|nr:TadE family protein [Phycicoccus avicenniae]MBR7743895.1 pilus assembly protein [Phycicoccus avicenniae]
MSRLPGFRDAGRVHIPSRGSSPSRPVGGRARTRSERGASALEFALVLPMLVALVGGIIDFGFLFSQQIAFNTAARDAARTAVTKPLTGSPQTCSNVATRARNASTQAGGALGVGPAGTRIEVTAPNGGCTMAAGSTSAGGPAQLCTGSSSDGSVTVAVIHESTPPFPVPFLNSVTLTGRGNFVCEYR